MIDPKLITAEEKAAAIDLCGEKAFERNGVYIINYLRIYALFPKQPPADAALRRLRGERP